MHFWEWRNSQVHISVQLALALSNKETIYELVSLVAQLVKNLPALQETWIQSLGWEDPLEKEMATPSSILAWKISWTEEPGGLQSMGVQRVRNDWVTNTYTFTYSPLINVYLEASITVFDAITNVNVHFYFGIVYCFYIHLELISVCWPCILHFAELIYHS